MTDAPVILPVIPASMPNPQPPGSMRNLYTFVPASIVTPDFRELAKSWPVWESATHQPPLVDDKVRFRYDGDYGSERILVVSGRATVIPDDGSPPVTIGPGDSLHLHYGFSCVWHIHEAMAQHYGYFDTSGNEIAENEMTCDVCGADCFEESYLFNDEQDICPKCFKADQQGAEEFTGAEYQREGKAAKPPPPKRPARASTGSAGGSAKKPKAKGGDYVPNEEESSDDDDEGSDDEYSERAAKKAKKIVKENVGALKEHKWTPKPAAVAADAVAAAAAAAQAAAAVTTAAAPAAPVPSAGPAAGPSAGPAAGPAAGAGRPGAGRPAASADAGAGPDANAAGAGADADVNADAGAGAHADANAGHDANADAGAGAYADDARHDSNADAAGGAGSGSGSGAAQPVRVHRVGGRRTARGKGCFCGLRRVTQQGLIYKRGEVLSERARQERLSLFALCNI